MVVTNEQLIALKTSMQKQFTKMLNDVVEAEASFMNQIGLLIDNNPTKPTNKTVDVDEDLVELVNTSRLVLTNDKDYIITHVFTTFNGSWDISPNQKYSIKQRFRDKFLKPISDPLYVSAGQKHIYVGVYDHNWLPVVGQQVFFSTKDDVHQIYKPTDKSGFANNEMSPNAAYWPSNGQSGFWYITLPNTTIKVSGIGLINKWHISTYIVIQKIN